MAARWTWLTVVIGVGGTMVVALFVVPLDAWQDMLVLFGCSAVFIILRSLHNEVTEGGDYGEAS